MTSFPNLEDIEADFLNGPCMIVLGDSVSYRAATGSFTPLKAYVDYGETLRDMQSGQVISQDITVQMLMTDVPVKPAASCRIRLGKLPGQTFYPVNVRTTRSGDHWEFEVARTDA